MKREEMLKRMRDVCAGGTSQLHMRSESIQSGNRVHRIPMLKKDVKKKAKLLVIADLAVPFNPDTGEEDEKYNVDNKYRPPFSATSVALSLKETANENEAVKQALMRRSGAKEWDTSDATVFTAQDWEIFRPYRVPRIFTVPVVSVNIPAVTGNDFGRDYSISVQRDPNTGEVIGEVPAILKINKLFRDKIYEEIQDYNSKISSGALKRTEKQQKEDKSDIYAKNPVSDEHPSNWITAIELPVTSQYKLSGDIAYDTIDAKGISNQLVLARCSKKIRTTLDAYVNGELEKFDKHFDFFEMDMACPADGETQTPKGKMDVGKDTTFEKPSYTIEECIEDATLANFNKAVTDYLDDCVHIEEEVRRSMYISPYTEDLENQLYTALPTVLDVEHDKYVTQKVMLANREVLTIAFAGVGSELLDSIDAGCSDAEDGALDEEKAKEEAVKYSLASLNSDDEEEDDYVPLSEVSMD